MRAGPAHCSVRTLLCYGTDFLQKLGGGGDRPILCQALSTDRGTWQPEMPDEPRYPPTTSVLQGAR